MENNKRAGKVIATLAILACVVGLFLGSGVLLFKSTNDTPVVRGTLWLVVNDQPPQPVVVGYQSTCTVTPQEVICARGAPGEGGPQLVSVSLATPPATPPVIQPSCPPDDVDCVAAKGHAQQSKSVLPPALSPSLPVPSKSQLDPASEVITCAEGDKACLEAQERLVCSPDTAECTINPLQSPSGEQSKLRRGANCAPEEGDCEALNAPGAELLF